MKKCLFILIAFAVFSACNKEDSTDKEQLIVSMSQFEDAPKDPFQFKKVTLVGDCLTIIINYGGGCGEVKALLIDSGGVDDSLPVQRYLRLSFEDDDLCEALVEKEFTFDLEPIKINSENQIKMNLEGWNVPILYSY